MDETSRPGGPIAARELHFIWICDCSGSMDENGKIQSLNRAVREALPHVKDAANSNPEAKVLMRVVAFSDSARWLVSAPTPLENFIWTDLTAVGETAMGAAMKLVADGLKIPPMPQRGLPPALVLMTDGQPTDDFNNGLKALMETPWGRHSRRIAVAIGGDAKRDNLVKFIGNPEIKVLEANNPESLAKQIKFLSTMAVSGISPVVNPTVDPVAPPIPVPVPDPVSPEPLPSATPGSDVEW
ncbi:MAG: VWA domain-containing protein [Coprothermobacterota bacterium]|nr:VWA domain-containing protein [Coprothermobacterota bacterium]